MKVTEGTKNRTGGNKGGNLNELVTRGEVIEITKQIVDNINQISQYLMDDVNTMYSKHVFPFQMRLAVLEDIVVKNEIATEEEINSMVEERIKKLQEQAKEIKEQQEAEAKTEDTVIEVAEDPEPAPEVTVESAKDEDGEATTEDFDSSDMGL